MIKERNVRFAVVGCGHIGKRHIEMILRNPDAELMAVCDINESVLSTVESLIGNKRPVNYYTDLSQLLSNESFDILNICTPNGWHARMAIAALESGRHTVIEKPMALTSKDAQRILEVADANQKKVFCVMQNRYSPPSAWLKELIESHRLGNIYTVQINCFWNRDERYYKPGGWHGTKDLDGGTLFTQFSHFVDLMFWLFGDICDIQARFNDFNHQTLTDFEDSGFVTFAFKKGGVGLFNYSTAVYDKNFESSVTITAEKGTVKVGGQYMNEVEYCHVEGYEMPVLPPTNPGNDYGAYKGSAQNHHYVIDNVVNVLLHRNGEQIKTNAYEGCKVVDIIERIYSKK